MANEPNHPGGHCACRSISYRLLAEPLIVHCCHCRWCQRETGSAFVINAFIEADRLEVMQGAVEKINTPSESGRGQVIVRCPQCHVALWSHYSSLGDKACAVRVGTLEDPDRFPPDVHIYTESKQPWVVLPEDAPVFARFYKPGEVWRAASLARLETLVAQ